MKKKEDEVSLSESNNVENVLLFCMTIPENSQH